MQTISRSQWEATLIEEFLVTPSTKQLHIALYKSEVKRLEKHFPILISMGPPVMASVADRRYHCIILKKANNA